MRKNVLYILFALALSSCNCSSGEKVVEGNNTSVDATDTSLTSLAVKSNNIVDEAVDTFSTVQHDEPLKDRFGAYKYKHLFVVVDSKTGKLKGLIEDGHNEPFISYECVGIEGNYHLFAYSIVHNEKFYKSSGYDESEVAPPYITELVEVKEDTLLLKGKAVFFDSVVIDMEYVEHWDAYDAKGFVSSFELERLGASLPSVKTCGESVSHLFSIKNEYDDKDMLLSVEFSLFGRTVLKYFFKDWYYIKYSNITELADNEGFKYSADVYVFQDISASAEYYGEVLESSGKAYSDTLDSEFYHIGVWNQVIDGKPWGKINYPTPSK